MPFDVQAQLFDPDGDCDAETFDVYVQDLLRLFDQSPECEVPSGSGWLSAVLDYGRSYFAHTAWGLTPEELHEILWHLFPEKVACDPEDGPSIIREVRAFLSFMDREFAKPDAQDCLAVLDEDSETRLQERLGDSRRYGMAKSFFMGGRSAGFDMQTDEDIQTWAMAHNESLGDQPSAARAKATPHAKARKKREKAARRKNRKKR